MHCRGFFPKKLDAVSFNDPERTRELANKMVSEVHIYIPSAVLFHYGLLKSGLVEFLSE